MREMMRKRRRVVAILGSEFSGWGDGDFGSLLGKEVSNVVREKNKGDFSDFTSIFEK